MILETGLENSIASFQVPAGEKEVLTEAHVRGAGVIFFTLDSNDSVLV